MNGERVPVVKEFHHVDVDVVPNGAAGGGFNHIMESLQTTTNKGAKKMKSKLYALFTMLYPTFLESRNVDWRLVDENELGTYLLEADKAQGNIRVPDGMQLTESVVDDNLRRLRESIKPAGSGPANELREALNELKINQTATVLEKELGASRLPEPLKESIRKQFSGRVVPVTEIKESIKQTRETWAAMTPTVPVISDW